MTTQFIAQDGDAFNASSGGTVADADMNAAINTALRWVGRTLCTVTPKVTLTTTAGVSFYPFSSSAWNRTVIKPIQLTHPSNGLFLDFVGRPGPYTLEQLNRKYPDWTGANAQALTAWADFGGQGVQLVGAPQSTLVMPCVAAAMPPTLAADGDVPDIPADLHEVVAYQAAWFLTAPVATDQTAWARLGQYSNQMMERTMEIANQNRRVAGLPEIQPPQPPQGGN